MNFNFSQLQHNRHFWTGLFAVVFLGVLVAGIVFGWAVPTGAPPTVSGAIRTVGSGIDQGNVGIGLLPTDPNPQSTLGIKGNASVGDIFTAQAASVDGLLIERSMGIGRNSPNNTLEIEGGISISGTSQRGLRNQSVPLPNIFIDLGISMPGRQAITVGVDGLPLIMFMHDLGTGFFSLRALHCTTLDCSSTEGPFIITNDIIATGDFGLMISTDGFPVIAYRAEDPGVGQRLGIVKCGSVNCDPASGSNSINYPVSDLSTKFGYAISMTIGSDGNPIIVSVEDDFDSAYVVHCSNTSCSSIFPTDPELILSGNSGNFSSITIGIDGFPIIVLKGSGSPVSNLYLIHCNDLSCTSYNEEIIDTGTKLGRFAEITISEFGLPILVYAEDSAGTDPKILYVYCRDLVCSFPRDETIISQPGNSISLGGLSLVVGRDGNPLIAFEENETIHLIKFGHATSTSGMINTVIESSMIRSVEMVVGADGLPFLFYRKNLNDIGRTAKCGSENCAGYWIRK